MTQPEGSRDRGEPEAARDLEALAFQRARAIAHAESNETLARNLRWYGARQEHTSHAAIARAEGRPQATIRTGVARARKFVLRVAHDLRYAQPAPLSGEAPAAIEALRQQWLGQDLEALAEGLERTRGALCEDPHWLNLAGLLAADRGRAGEAARHYERALVHADAPGVRARVLNNLANLVDPHDPDEARGYWLRARALLPDAPTPLLNLLASASHARDYTATQHYLGELAALLRSARLSLDERSYVQRRLREHPKLEWLRETDAWRQGPARWLQPRRQRASGRALSGALALLLALALQYAAPAPAHDAAALEVAASPAAHAGAGTPNAGARKGGDSMGGPHRG